jgi:hypothetical protein
MYADSCPTHLLLLLLYISSVTTVVINNLYDEIDDLEDELELAAEEAYLTEAAIEDADAADAAGGTMEDLEKK